MGRFGCLWILMAAVFAYAGFVLGWSILFPITQQSYANCVARVIADRQRNVALCVQQRLDDDLEKSRKELPVLPSRAEHEASCRYIWGDTPENNCRPPKNSN